MINFKFKVCALNFSTFHVQAGYKGDSDVLGTPQNEIHSIIHFYFTYLDPELFEGVLYDVAAK